MMHLDAMRLKQEKRPRIIVLLEIDQPRHAGRDYSLRALKTRAHRGQQDIATLSALAARCLGVWEVARRAVGECSGRVSATLANLTVLGGTVRTATDDHAVTNKNATHLLTPTERSVMISKESLLQIRRVEPIDGGDIDHRESRPLKPYGETILAKILLLDGDDGRFRGREPIDDARPVTERPDRQPGRRKGRCRPV